MADRAITTSDGTRIRYRITGRGFPPIVLVHGWCSNRNHWAAQVDHFADRHKVLAVDRRGHGDSDVPPSGYTAAQHAHDLAEVLVRERITDAVVVGHAGGAPGVLALARSFPELARALVLIDTTISARTALGRRDGAPRSGLAALIDRLDAPDGADAFASLYRGFFSPWAGDVADRAVADARRVPLPVARAELASLAVSTEAMARAIRQPVLWLSVAAADQPRLTALFRDVRFGQVVGSGHFPHLEVPEQVNAMIDRFVDTL
ncbi:MAG: alpha/beta hydrolase [Acidimicrobiales bacterium]|jgi:pimeloyl-ACP methyl ester carboxylesterase|nr:alpha/beta hydrolase [Acidimicrobiales bacterium]